MAAVVACARLRGWLVHHQYDARRGTPGLPDLLMVRGGRLVFAELKVGGNKATAEQQRWLDELRAVPGVAAHLWRPSDWDEIEEVLR